MYFLTITEFVAHLHPALVHLPIGILLTALLLQLLARWKKFAAFRSAIPTVLLIGLISAILSCITGFLLSHSGDYDDTLVSTHMWLAIALTFVTFALYARVGFGGAAGKIFDRNSSLLGIGLFLLIMITGHLGGSLTHGEDYLTSSFKNEPPPPVFRPIADIQQAAVYEDIVKPIMSSRCNNCHGPNRQKGGLRLDNPEWIAKGGKDGVILIAGRADSSDLIRRLRLPDNDEHHMPPKDRPQLTSQEQQILAWWVDQGADYRKQVKDLTQPEKVRSALVAIQQRSMGAGADKSTATTADVSPDKEVDAANEKDIEALQKAGAVVTAMAQNSHYLSVDLMGAPATSLIPLLPPVKKQLVQLNLANTGAGDSSMEVIKQCAALRVVNLTNTKITDKALPVLTALPELRVLNLVGTNVTGPGLLAVQAPKHLHVLYLYHTRVERKDWAKLVTLYKTAVLDSGGYSLPVLVTDTAIVRSNKN